MIDAMIMVALTMSHVVLASRPLTGRTRSEAPRVLLRVPQGTRMLALHLRLQLERVLPQVREGCRKFEGRVGFGDGFVAVAGPGQTLTA